MSNPKVLIIDDEGISLIAKAMNGMEALEMYSAMNHTQQEWS